MAITEQHPKNLPQADKYDVVQPGWEDNAYYRRYRWRKRIGALAMVTASAAAWAAADRITGDVLWHGRQTEVRLLADQPERQTDTEWIIVPGLGVQSGEGIASVLEDTLSTTGEIAYAEYSDDGVSPLELADDINQLLKERKVRNINFYAHSMGGSIMLRVLPYLDKQYKINTIVLDCSPSSIYDAKNVLAPLTGSFAPPYEGGLLSKGAMELVNNTMLHENPNLTIPEQVKDAVRVTLTGSSPRLWSNQMGILKTTDIWDYKDYLTDVKNIYYVMPDDANADDTVYTRAAIAEWQRMLGNQANIIIVKGGGHANATDRPSEYKEAFTPYLNEPLRQATIYQKYRQ